MKKRIVYGGKVKKSEPAKSHMTAQKVRTPEDLGELDKAGLIAFLNSDRPDKIALWNMKYGSYQDEPLDLEGAYLAGTNLENIRLNYVNLIGATLSKSNLANAQLKEANLKGSFLNDAILEGAYLIGAHLENAQLAGVNLRVSDLSGAYMEGADLSGADLREATLTQGQLTGVRLDMARMEGANLSNANLQGAYLPNTQLTKAKVEGAIFKWAILTGANFTGANLFRAQFEGAAVDGANFAEADLRLAQFRDVALSSLKNGGLVGVKLDETYFWGVLNLRYEQFLADENNPTSVSTIWEDTECCFSKAKDIYKSLKGYFEDAGDYEGANWAYHNEQQMEKLMHTPLGARRLYPIKRWNPDEEGKTFWKPNTLAWLGLEIADKLAGYGLSIVKPLIWLLVLIFSCSAIYWIGGMVTGIPGCGFADLAATWRAGCAASSNPIHSLLFSLGAMTTIDVGNVQAYREYVGVLAALEAVFGIILTGLLGFVLGNKLRNS